MKSPSDPSAKASHREGPARSETPAVVPRDIVLWAGDLCVVTEPTRLTTILGSCVAVCLYDRARRFGGMNHYLLPTGGESKRGGDWSTQQLVARMLEFGSCPDDLRAKIFGGATSAILRHPQWAVGNANVRIAKRVLHEAHVPIVAERTGETAGMRVTFESWSGAAWVRPHASNSQAR